MSDIDKLERKYNNRLKANGFQPVRPDDNSWWDKFCIDFARRHQHDPELLVKGPRPMHEEWTDIDGAVWVADGAGVLYCLGTTETVNQEAANGFILHELQRWWLPDFGKLVERALLAGVSSYDIGKQLAELGGPFGPNSWVAYGRFTQRILEHEQGVTWQEKAAKQDRNRKARSTKTRDVQLRDACPSERAPTDA